MQLHKEHEEGTKLHKGISLRSSVYPLWTLCHGLKSRLYVLALCNFMALACDKGDPSPVEPPVTTAKTFYVAASGSDVNAGTQAAPLKTISKAFDLASPGDTVFVRGGIYHQRVVCRKSGEPGKPITLKAFPGELAAISGEGLEASGADALVTIHNVHDITLEGFHIRDFVTTTAYGVNGITVSGTSSNITIRKNRVHDIKHNGPLDNYLRNAHAIQVTGNSTAAPISNIIIDSNVIHDCNTGYSENLTVHGNVDGVQITNNKMYNAENIGIYVGNGGGVFPPEVTSFWVRNGVVSGNEVWKVESATGPLGGYGAIGIYIDGSRNIVVERNRVYDSDRGIGLVSENTSYPTKDCIVRNNFVFNCWRGGIYLGGYLNYTTGGTKSCHVVNNTLYKNNKVLGYFGEVEGEIRLTEDCFDNVITNNLIYASPANDVFVHKYTNTGANNIIDHNLFYSSGSYTWIWNGVSHTNFTSWKTASGGDGNSSIGIDPLLVSTSIPDLHITTGSPARNTGLVIGAAINGEMDIDGQPRIINNLISKGAHQ